MSIARKNRDACIGCQSCVDRCPMDVFYYDPLENKSVIVYPENCQSCGQCYLNCQGRSLGISNDTYGYPITALRGASSADMNHRIVTQRGVLKEITKGKLP